MGVSHAGLGVYRYENSMAEAVGKQYGSSCTSGCATRKEQRFAAESGWSTTTCFTRSSPPENELLQALPRQQR